MVSRVQIDEENLFQMSKQRFYISVFFFKAFMRFDRGTGQVIVILLFEQKYPRLLYTVKSTPF